MPTEELFLSARNKQTNYNRIPGHSAENFQILVVYSIGINQRSSENQGKQKCILMTNAKVIRPQSIAYNHCTVTSNSKILEDQRNHTLWCWWLSALKFSCERSLYSWFICRWILVWEIISDCIREFWYEFRYICIWTTTKSKYTISSWSFTKISVERTVNEVLRSTCMCSALLLCSKDRHQRTHLS